MSSTKVAQWVNTDLRYVGEGKLARLSDEELQELHRQMVDKCGDVYVQTSGDQADLIGRVLALKKRWLDMKPKEPEPEPHGGAGKLSC